MFPIRQPRITGVNRPFWDGCRADKLMLQRCGGAYSIWMDNRPSLGDSLLAIGHR
jgi:hypothetical protein